MIMRNESEHGWEYVRRELEAVRRMPITPEGIKKVPLGHIFDPYKSASWNRDKVAESNSAYMIEVARLMTLRNKRQEAAFEEAYRLIQEYIGHGLSRPKAVRIWNYAWNLGHGRFSEIIPYLQDVSDLVKAILRD